MPLIESFSGIRGIYDKGLDEKVALRYTYSYLYYLKNIYKKGNLNKKLKIVIGTDTRPSKDMIKNAVIEAVDCDAIDIGIASTPMTEFAVRHFDADGGIMITASHNEPYWNGFKFLDSDGSILSQIEMEKVIQTYKNISKLNDKKFFNNHLYKNIDPKNINIKKIYKKYDEINNSYTDYVLNFLSNEDRSKIKRSKLKVILDPNGGTGTISKSILEKLGVKVHGINMKHGIFNRKIEPSEESLIYLTNDVRNKNYDFAAGFDCDADRVEIMTSKGLISGNDILALIADEVLKNSNNKIIIVNNATSSKVREIAKKYKAKYYETEVGEINVVNKIYKLKAPIGGEGSSSGVIIPPSRCRDGILTIIYILKIISNYNKNINELVKNLPQYFNIKKNIKLSSKNYPNIIKKLTKHYEKEGYSIKYSKYGSVKILINGNTFIWFRISKTESNILRIIADSPQKSKSNFLIKQAVNLIKN